jgi:hypothetical protein
MFLTFYILDKLILGREEGVIRPNFYIYIFSSIIVKNNNINTRIKDYNSLIVLIIYFLFLSYLGTYLGSEDSKAIIA